MMKLRPLVRTPRVRPMSLVTQKGRDVLPSARAVSLDGVNESIQANSRVMNASRPQLTMICWFRVTAWRTAIQCCEWVGSAAQDSWIMATARANEGFPATTPTPTTRAYLDDDGALGGGFSIIEHASSEVLNSWIQLAIVFNGGATGQDNQAQMWRAVGDDVVFTRLTVTHNYANIGAGRHPTALGFPTSLGFTIGARADGQDFFNGVIGETAVFARALTEAELNLTRHGTKPANLLHHPHRNLLHYWFRPGNVPGDTTTTIRNLSYMDGGMTATCNNLEAADLVAW